MSPRPLKIVVTGAAGRMGRAIVAALAAAPGLSLVGATESAGSPHLGRDAGELAGVGSLKVTVTDTLAPLLATADAVIDFTGPAASVSHAAACAAHGTALVIGSTGFTSEQKAALAEAATRTALVVAPNMSVGVNLLFRLAAEAARVLGPGFDVEVVEAHHRHKKDAPSGTAVRLAEVLAEAMGVDPATDVQHGREGITGARPGGVIGMHAVRGGDVVGDHTVLLLGDGERVELTHRATSRSNFAEGALRAARWLPGRAPGVYDMGDVLGFARRAG